MALNPYQVLGVSETASDDEIRAAYRELVKKYHPDKYQDNPLKNPADEKLKEINEAYDTITRQRKNSTASSYAYGNTGSDSGFSGSSYRASSPDLIQVRRLLNNQRIQEARRALEAITVRGAEWNYLYGITLFRSGEYASARRYLDLAAQMEPGNAEYGNAANSFSAYGTRGYHSYGDDRGGMGDSCSGGGLCRVCSAIWCLDSCCECTGGDICRCC